MVDHGLVGTFFRLLDHRLRRRLYDERSIRRGLPKAQRSQSHDQFFDIPFRAVIDRDFQSIALDHRRTVQLGNLSPRDRARHERIGQERSSFGIEGKVAAHIRRRYLEVILIAIQGKQQAGAVESLALQLVHQLVKILVIDDGAIGSSFFLILLFLTQGSGYVPQGRFSVILGETGWDCQSQECNQNENAPSH